MERGPGMTRGVPAVAIRKPDLDGLRDVFARILRVCAEGK